MDYATFIFLCVCSIAFAIFIINKEDDPEKTYQKVRKFEENIYYFPCTGTAFAINLARLLKERKNMEVAAITLGGMEFAGTASGYFVVLRHKEAQ